MKKLLLSLSATALLSYQASAQNDLSLSLEPVAGSTSLGCTFGSTITLTVSGTLRADVESVNLLLRNAIDWGKSAAGIPYGSGDQRECLLLYMKQSGFSHVMFTTAEDTFNSGRTVSDSGLDRRQRRRGPTRDKQRERYQELAVDTVTFHCH